MYFFYFTEENEEPICLPVTPGQRTTKTPGKNKTVELISTGEYNILKDIGLRELNFEVLLPATEYIFVQTHRDFQKPDYYLEKFRKFKVDKKPVRFIITRTDPKGEEIHHENMLVSLEDFTEKEYGGESGDIWIDLKLKEYREVMAIVQEVQSIDAEGVPIVEETVQRPAKEPAKEYTVQKDDSLWAIAKRELNDDSRYQEIAELNGIKDYSQLTPGQTLKLPG